VLLHRFRRLRGEETSFESPKFRRPFLLRTFPGLVTTQAPDATRGDDKSTYPQESESESESAPAPSGSEGDGTGELFDSHCAGPVVDPETFQQAIDEDEDSEEIRSPRRRYRSSMPGAFDILARHDSQPHEDDPFVSREIPVLDASTSDPAGATITSEPHKEVIVDDASCVSPSSDDQGSTTASQNQTTETDEVTDATAGSGILSASSASVAHTSSAESNSDDDSSSQVHDNSFFDETRSTTVVDDTFPFSIPQTAKELPVYSENQSIDGDATSIPDEDESTPAGSSTPVPVESTPDITSGAMAADHIVPSDKSMTLDQTNLPRYDTYPSDTSSAAESWDQSEAASPPATSQPSLFRDHSISRPNSLSTVRTPRTSWNRNKPLPKLEDSDPPTSRSRRTRPGRVNSPPRIPSLTASVFYPISDSPDLGPLLSPVVTKPKVITEKPALEDDRRTNRHRSRLSSTPERTLWPSTSGTTHKPYSQPVRRRKNTYPSSRLRFDPQEADDEEEEDTDVLVEADVQASKVNLAQEPRRSVDVVEPTVEMDPASGSAKRQRRKTDWRSSIGRLFKTKMPRLLSRSAGVSKTSSM
jgi:hypothetical protein